MRGAIVGSADGMEQRPGREGEFLHFALYQGKDGRVTQRSQVAFRVVDLEAAHARAVDAGAALIHGPQAQPWGRSARYEDPDGNVIELTERL